MTKYIIPLLALFAFGCGDKSEDTGDTGDTSVPGDTSDTGGSDTGGSDTGEDTGDSGSEE